MSSKALTAKLKNNVILFYEMTRFLSVCQSVVTTRTQLSDTPGKKLTLKNNLILAIFFVRICRISFIVEIQKMNKIKTEKDLKFSTSHKLTFIFQR